MTSQIAGPWAGDGLTVATARRPQLVVDHPLPQGATCSDVTGQPATNLPPTPNLFVVELRGVSQAWLDGVEADANYSVLWSE